MFDLILVLNCNISKPGDPTVTTTATLPQGNAISTRMWTVDPMHAEVGFAVRHLMISTVRGRFGRVAGTVQLDEQRPENAKIDVEIDVTSIDTRQDQRDGHLRSPDFFDAEHHPTMHFASTGIEGDVSGDFTITGDLTIRGNTRPVTLQASAEGRGRDPWGNDRAGFSATGKLNRSDFGLTWNQVLEAGGVTVGDEVKLSIDVELILQAAKPVAA
jgi:polyisoprenoid-binding protein YceI